MRTTITPSLFKSLVILCCSGCHLLPGVLPPRNQLTRDDGRTGVRGDVGAPLSDLDAKDRGGGGTRT